MTNVTELIPHIESLIFASDKPLTSAEITELVNQAFGFMEDKIEQEQIDAAINGIVEKYQSEFYPFEVVMSGGGWQFLTKKEFHKTVAQLNGEKFLKRLSAAALETLAIIAYKQPITKGEIEAIRGVSSDYSVQKLLEKELIVISGRNEKLPGHPLVYNTSKNFMDYFGINSPEDLPKIREVLADQIIEPTIVNHTDFEQSDTLLVTGDGELVDAKLAAGEPHVNGTPLDSLINATEETPEEPVSEEITEESAEGDHSQHTEDTIEEQEEEQEAEGEDEDEKEADAIDEETTEDNSTDEDNEEDK
jgi:segregation and condensation protein B